MFRIFLKLGFTHNVPKGLDHILFVIGLFLLSTRISTLFWQMSAFTIAHTFTLALSMLGILQLSPVVVEPLIALSITRLPPSILLQDSHNLSFCESGFTHCRSPRLIDYGRELQECVGIFQGVLTDAPVASPCLTRPCER